MAIFDFFASWRSRMPPTAPGPGAENIDVSSADFTSSRYTYFRAVRNGSTSTGDVRAVGEDGNAFTIQSMQPGEIRVVNMKQILTSGTTSTIAAKLEVYY